MANTTMNAGKTDASMASAAANMASTAMVMVNSATVMTCHEQADARTTAGPRHLQLALQGNAGIGAH